MRLSRSAAQIGTITTAALAFSLVAPVPMANAGITARCGYEESGSDALYYNCVYNKVLVRVDVVGHGSSNDWCLWFEPWERRRLGNKQDILNAYALGSGICNI